MFSVAEIHGYDSKARSYLWRVISVAKNEALYNIKSSENQQSIKGGPQKKN